MELTDVLYGKFSVNEQVLCDIITSPQLQRLKGVDQAGYPKPWINSDPINRYDHSIGVFLLLRMFGAEIEEQIAGLLHDISHTAFSHSIDYAINKSEQHLQNYQDLQYEKQLLGGPLPGILQSHGFDASTFLDLDKFTLLETSLPDLCADRIDYSLRTIHSLREKTSSQRIYRYLGALSCDSSKWFMTDAAVSLLYGLDFAQLSDNWYAGLPSAKMFSTTGDCIAHAIDKGYLNAESLVATDAQVCDTLKLYMKHDATLTRLWNRMNGMVTITVDDKNPTHTIVCKNRRINPLVCEHGEYVRTSTLYPNVLPIADMKPKVWKLRISDEFSC